MVQSKFKLVLGKLLEIFVLFLIIHIVNLSLFYSFWVPAPPPKIVFYIIEVFFVVGYLKLLNKYLDKKEGVTKLLKYQFIKNIFLIFFVISILAYIGASPNNPSEGDYTKAYMAVMTLVSFVCFIVHLILLKRAKNNTKNIEN